MRLFFAFFFIFLYNFVLGQKASINFNSNIYVVSFTVEINTVDSDIVFKATIKNNSKDSYTIRSKPFISYYFPCHDDSLRQTLFYNLSDINLVKDERHRHDNFFVMKLLPAKHEVILWDTFPNYYNYKEDGVEKTIKFNRIQFAFSDIKSSKLSLKKDFYFYDDRNGQIKFYKKLAGKKKIQPKLIKINAFQKHRSNLKFFNTKY